jgi:S-adenosylmethionine decarboxylase proenzyme
MRGLHLTADLHRCDGDPLLLADAAALRQLCLTLVASAGLHAVADLFHPFETAGGGVTGVVLLAESHLAVHTWPERSAVTLDVYVCNLGRDNAGRANELLHALIAAFAPQIAHTQRVARGGDAE